MIAKLKDRKLGWYFENVWLPAHRESIHGSLVALIRRTVADFLAFAEGDPAMSEVTDESLAEFEHASKAQGFSGVVSRNRRDRIAEIVDHAIPPETKATPRPLPNKAAEGTLRRYVRDTLPILKPDLRSKSIANYAYVVERFCRYLGEDIAVADVTPEQIEEFEEANSRAKSTSRQHAMRLRTLMRTFDPMRFHIRQPPREDKRLKLDTGDGSEFLLANIYEKRYEPTALRSRAFHTKRLYRTTLAMLDRFLERPATLDDLTDETVSKFAAWRLESVCRHTVNKDLFNLLALWRWCHRKRLVEAWPDVEMEKGMRRSPVAWSEPEIRKLYQTIVGLPGRVGKLPACDWWAALLLVAWDSGERINAIIRLEWSNVDLRRKWIRFPAEDRKGGRDDSTVRLSDDAVEALRKIQATAGPVFPWPYCYTYLWDRLAVILRRAGLPDDCKSKFHRIRKTVASYAEAAGADATKMLRHSKREITEAYLDPKIVTRQQPVDVLFRLDGEGGAA